MSDHERVLLPAGEALGIADFDAYFLAMRKSVGPPWGTDHKVALAAAIVAARRFRSDAIGSTD